MIPLEGVPDYPLAPGSIIEFGDITELAAFEDLVANEVEPRSNHDRGAWPGRVALKDLIRPPKFNGTIADVRLEVMEAPYERLIDCRQRGWQLPGSGNFSLSTEFAEQLIPRYKGFIMTADAKSSGRGVIGQIQAELWYYPMPLYRVTYKAGTVDRRKHQSRETGQVTEHLYTRQNDRTAAVRTRGTGETIRRIVSKPRIEKEKFTGFDETARRIGMSVLVQSLAHPISTPMQG